MPAAASRPALGAALIPSVILLAWPWVFGLSPLLAGGSARTGFILLAPVAIGLLLAFHVRARLFTARAAAAYLALFAAFALLWALAVLRADTVVLEDSTARLGLAVTMLLVLVLAALVFHPINRPGAARKLLDAFALALPLYLAINLILFVTFGPEWLEPARKVYFPQMSGLAALIGIQTPRVTSMGLMTGSNVIGLQAGASIVLLSAMLLSRKALVFRIGAGALLTASIIILLLVETRIVLAAAPIAVAALHFLDREKLLLAGRWTVAAAAASPVVMSLLLWGLSSTTISSALVRQGQDGEALGVGTGRAFMLDAGVGGLGIENVFGYGFYGHEPSGVMGSFHWIFQSPERSSLHNTMLQNLYDIGLVGAALYIALLLASFRILARTALLPAPAAKALMGFLLFVVLTSFTEVSGAPYHLNLFVLQAMLFGFVFVASEAQKAPRPSGRKIAWTGTHSPSPRWKSRQSPSSSP